MSPTPSAWEIRVRDLRAAIDTSSGQAYAQALEDFSSLDPLEREFLALDIQLTTAEATAATSRELRRIRGLLKVISDELAKAQLARVSRAMVQGLGEAVELLEDISGSDLPPAEPDDERDPDETLDGSIEGPGGQEYVDEDGNPLDIEPFDPADEPTAAAAPEPAPAPAPPAPAPAPKPAPKNPAPKKPATRRRTPKKKDPDAAPAPAPRRRTTRTRKSGAASKQPAEAVATATGHPAPE